MKRTARVIVFCLWVGVGASSFAAQPALAESDLVSDVAPPAIRNERAPAPRDGYVWNPGHWEWTGHAYSWATGTWIVERRGAEWIPDRWDQLGTQWHFTKGHWQHQPSR